VHLSPCRRRAAGQGGHGAAGARRVPAAWPCGGRRQGSAHRLWRKSGRRKVPADNDTTAWSSHKHLEQLQACVPTCTSCGELQRRAAPRARARAPRRPPGARRRPARPPAHARRRRRACPARRPPRRAVLGAARAARAAGRRARRPQSRTRRPRPRLTCLPAARRRGAVGRRRECQKRRAGRREASCRAGSERCARA